MLTVVLPAHQLLESVLEDEPQHEQSLAILAKLKELKEAKRLDVLEARAISPLPDGPPDRVTKDQAAATDANTDAPLLSSAADAAKAASGPRVGKSSLTADDGLHDLGAKGRGGA